MFVHIPVDSFDRLNFLKLFLVFSLPLLCTAEGLPKSIVCLQKPTGFHTDPYKVEIQTNYLSSNKILIRKEFFYYDKYIIPWIAVGSMKENSNFWDIFFEKIGSKDYYMSYSFQVPKNSQNFKIHLLGREMDCTLSQNELNLPERQSEIFVDVKNRLKTSVSAYPSDAFELVKDGKVTEIKKNQAGHIIEVTPDFHTVFISFDPNCTEKSCALELRAQTYGADYGNLCQDSLPNLCLVHYLIKAVPLRYSIVIHSYSKKDILLQPILSDRKVLFLGTDRQDFCNGNRDPSDLMNPNDCFAEFVSINFR